MRKLLTVTVLIVSLLLITSCQTARQEEQSIPSTEAVITGFEKYGHAVLDTTIEDFNNLGFELGDVVTVTTDDGKAYDMPYFDGYYVDRGAMMLRAYPGHTNIAVCINYGKFGEEAGVKEGDKLTITLKEKKGELATQTIYSLVYSNDRADFASDEVFANFRPVVIGNILPGRLYRSCSPINNENNRASTANALAEKAGIMTVLNLADTDDEIRGYAAADDFDSEYYFSLFENGSVIALGMSVNYQSSGFASDVVKGLTFLSEHDTPYLVHCTEGKDRAGFVSALIEALMGGSEEEIIADYMTSYENYYGVEPGTEKYQIIAEKNIVQMLKTIAGIPDDSSLEGIDLSKAAEEYLIKNGMTQTAIDNLKAHLSK